jgi:hypothetical protein
MGLDMYLTKKTYVKNWDHFKPEERFQIEIKQDNKPYTKIDLKRIMYIEEEIMYWRKSNAIHNWFVKNVQEGNDDCNHYYLQQVKLQELLELLKKVKSILDITSITKKKVVVGQSFENGIQKDEIQEINIYESKEIEKLLPPTEGFFFGSTDINDWFKQDVEETIKVLEDELKEESFESYYYHSSW